MADSIPLDAVSLPDYERLARECLDEGRRAYLDGGSGDGHLRTANRRDWSKVCLWPHALTDLNKVSTEIELFGRHHPAPLLIAPSAWHRLFHPQGEIATAAAAAALGLTYCVSAQTSIQLEKIAAVAPQSPRWLQLYLQPGRDFIAALIERARNLGFEALVVTVDAPVHGIRNEEQRSGFVLPPGVESVEQRDAPAPPAVDSVQAPAFLRRLPRWEDIAWLRKQTGLPILLKGLLHPADARRAVESGVDGIVVSNHGGRTFDAAPTTREALPRVVETVGGQVPVLVDGGLRRGTEVLAALALGATAVMIGRPVLHGLAVAGAAGAAHVLRLLRHELEVALVQSGCPRPSEAGRLLDCGDGED